MAENPSKKVVRVQATPEEQAAAASAPNWTPTAQSKGQATTFRWIAVVLWVLAIGGEAFGIFWVLKQNPVNMIILIALLVVIALLAIGGSLLWKRSNRLDPASKSEPVRFFVQNQLGAIITVIAFVPLIVLIFTDKNMSGQQKGVAGGIGIVLLLVAGYFGVSINPPSTEQYTAETQQVTDATGQNLVYWTKDGQVFHLCSSASAVNLTSKDNQIYSGTVAEAHAAGKSRLTLQVAEERKQCGFDTTSTPVPSPTP
jgi:hypothetical protein